MRLSQKQCSHSHRLISQTCRSMSKNISRGIASSAQFSVPIQYCPKFCNNAYPVALKIPTQRYQTPRPTHSNTTMNPPYHAINVTIPPRTLRPPSPSRHHLYHHSSLSRSQSGRDGLVSQLPDSDRYLLVRDGLRYLA